MTIRKDFDGDVLKRAIDTKPQAVVKHAGKPFWLRRDVEMARRLQACVRLINELEGK